MASCVVKGRELGLESGFPALGPVPPHPQLVPLATKRMDGEHGAGSASHLHPAPAQGQVLEDL